MMDGFDKGFVVIWVVGVVLALAFWALVAWGIFELVSWVVAQ